MGFINTTTENNHHESMNLLPWYVNGTLDDSERLFVEKHTKVCLHCRRELANLEKLAGQVVSTNVFDMASQGSFSVLKQRISRETKRVEQPLILANQFGRIYKSIIERVSQGSRQNRFILAFLVVTLVALPGLFISTLLHVDNQPPVYRTLSDKLADKMELKTEHRRLRVIFKEGVERKTIDRILGSIHGRIVEGPDSRGVIHVQIEDQNIKQSTLSSRLAELRTNPNVIFVEPTISLSSK